MKKKRGIFKKIVWFFNFVILFLLPTFLFIDYQKLFQNLLQKKENEISQPVVESSFQAEKQVIETTNWKIYEDSLYDFKIKYPSHWSNPQTQVIDDENSVYQYQVDFGTEKTLNEDGSEGFSIFVSKKNIISKNIITNDKNEQNQENLDQENSQELSSSNRFDIPKIAEDYASNYSYQFMGQNYEYKLVPVLFNDLNSTFFRFKNLKEFETAKDTFLIDFESIQQKAVKLEKERVLAVQKAEKLRQERIAASQRKLKSCPKENKGDPSYSKTKGKHVDEDCCPDPDEWPKSGCRYSASDYAIMLKGSPKKK